MIKRFMLLAAGVAVACAASATEQVQFDGTSASWGSWIADEVNGGGGFNYGPGGWLGELQFTALNPTGQNLFGTSPFNTVCGDLSDEISTNNIYNVTYSDTATMVDPYKAAGSIVGYAGSLDSVNGSLSVLSQPQAEGLQLAVWECMYDWTNDSSINTEASFEAALTSGSQKIGNYNDLLSGGVVDAAWSFWQGGLVTGDVSGGAVNDGLYDSVFIQGAGGVNFNGAGQNQFAPFRPNHHDVSTPEPFTMGLGVAGIALFVRKRVKRS